MQPTMAEPTRTFRPAPEAAGLDGVFLDAVRQGRLALQQCGACDRHWHYPRPVCPHCGSREWIWVDAAGTGVVHSFTIVHRAPIPALKALTPYVLAMIDLDEGARVTSILIGEDADEAEIGDAVRVVFPKGPEGEAGMPVVRRVS